MKVSRYFASTAVALVMGALAACGGGGGGGGSGGGGGGAAPPAGRLQYSGNSLPAVVSTSSASKLFGFVMFDSDDAIEGSSVSGGAVQAAAGQIEIGRRLGWTVRKTVRPGAVMSRASSAPVEQTDACSGGGTVRYFGDLGPTGVGTLTVIYTNCVEDGETTTGQATMSIEGYDPFGGVYTFYTLSFEQLSVRGPTNADMAGSLQVVTTAATNSVRTTENMVLFYVNSARKTKSENLVFVDVYDDIHNPKSFTESINGRLYHSTRGYIDFTTVTPLGSSTMTQRFPESGEILITGAANARIRATAASSSVVVLALDSNGDGVFETQATVKWTDLTGPAGADLADSDGDGMHNSWESAYGLNPFVNDAGGDSDNDGFTNLAEYFAGNLPNAHDAVLPPIPVIARTVALADNSDIVYDPVTQRIYAAVRTNPGRVVPINPATGALGTAISVGSNPTKLALSDNGQYLYVGLENAATVQRINMATQAVDLTIALGNDPFLGPYSVSDMKVLPGAAQSIAVSRRNCCSHAGVAIFDGNAQRPNTTPGHTGSTVIEFSASANTLYGYNKETTEAGFRRMAVDASGVTVIDVYDMFQPGGPLIVGGFVDMKFGGGFIFTTSGQMIDPVARVQLPNPSGAAGPTLLPSGVFGFVAPDAALGRVFYLLTDRSWNILAFDTNTRLQTGSAKVGGITGNPLNLIRWGAKGLAFSTFEGQIVMLESPVLIR